MQSNHSYHRMYENGIDQLFGNKLEHYPATGNGGNWEALQNRLDEHDRNRKKKTGYGKWLAAFLLLTGLTAGLVYTTSSGNKKTAQTPVALAETTNNSSPVNDNTQTRYNNDNKTNTVTTTNNSGTDNNSNTPASGAPAINGSTPNNTPVQNKDADITATARTIAISTPVTRSGRKTYFNKPVFYAKNNTVNSKQKSINTPAYSPKQDAYNTNGETTNKSASETAIAEAGTEQPEYTKTMETGKPVAEQQPAATEPMAVQENKETLAALQTETAKPVNPAETKNSLLLNINNASNNNATVSATKKVKTKKQRVRREAPEHEFTSGQGQWYVEAFSGYNSSVKDNKSFAAFLAPAGYVEKRLKQENTLLSLQAGVNVKYRRNHLIFGAGLSYLELGDMVNYDASLSGPVALNANGRAKLTYLEIPLSAGYDWASKRWGFSIQGGISAGLLMGARGQYVSSSSFSSGLFNLEENKSMFRKTQLNLLVAPSVNYFVNENTNIFVAPLYRLNLQPVTITGASLNQKYYGMGLRVGIRTSLRR